MIDYNSRYLIITAHPDDLEMSCAGTIRKILSNGGTVTNWIMVKPMADTRTNRPQKKVMQELNESSRILGQVVDVYDNESYHNGRPKLQLNPNIITELEDKAKGFDVIMSHWHEDYHQDHKVCFDIAQILSRKNFKQFLCFDQPIYNRFYKTFKKNVYVDISDHIETKISALRCYDSYFNDSDIDSIISYNRYNGSFIGNDKFAETFNLIYSKQ